MKKVIIFLTLCISVTCMFAQQAPQQPLVPPNPIEKPGWKLTFHDEFDSPLLDDQYWYAAYKSGRTEYLKRNDGEYGFYHNSNALYKIENGILKLIIDESVPPRLKKTDGAVSCIQTSDFRFTDKNKTEFQVLEKFAQKYGWFEVRCKTVKGTGGLYTAFWLYVTDPTDQEFTPQGKRRPDGDGAVEIDIFELLANEAESGNNHFNVHFVKGDGHYQYEMGFDPSEGFHIYAVEWKENEINWYVDNKKVQTYRGDTPQKKMFILLALFHGVHTGWIGKVPEKQTYPAVFEVDYIRVYQTKS